MDKGLINTLNRIADDNFYPPDQFLLLKAEDVNENNLRDYTIRDYTISDPENNFVLYNGHYFVKLNDYIFNRFNAALENNRIIVPIVLQQDSRVLNQQTGQYTNIPRGQIVNTLKRMSGPSINTVIPPPDFLYNFARDKMTMFKDPDETEQSFEGRKRSKFNEIYNEERLILIAKSLSDLDNEITVQIKVAAIHGEFSKFLMLLRPEELSSWGIDPRTIITFPEKEPILDENGNVIEEVVQETKSEAGTQTEERIGDESKTYTFVRITDFIASKLHDETLLDIRNKIVTRNKEVSNNDIVNIALDHLVGPQNINIKKRNTNIFGSIYNREYDMYIYDEVFKQIKDFYEVFNVKIDDRRILVDNFNTWRSQQENLLKSDKVKLESIINDQTSLFNINTKIPGTRITSFFFTEVEYFYKPKYQNRKVQLDSALDFFNLMHATPYVPYIHYSGLSENDYKIFNSSVEGKNLNYEYIISEGKKLRNHIYFTLWSPRPGADRYSKESYRPGRYNLETGTLSVDLIIKGDDPTEIRLEMEKHLQEAFPLNMEFGIYEEKNISGKFNILNTEFDQITLSDFIMNSDLFRDYFFIDEQKKSLEDKVRFVINFFSLIDVKVKNEKRRIERASDTPKAPSSVEVRLVALKTEMNQTFSFLVPKDRDSFGTITANVSIGAPTNTNTEGSDEFIFNPNRTKKITGIAVANEEITGNNFSVDSSYIQISVYKSYSTDILNQFASFLQKMLNVYLNGYSDNRYSFKKRYDLQNEYYYLLPYHREQNEKVNIENLLSRISNEKKVSKKRKEHQKLAALAKEIPELFEKKYTDLCQGDKKPTVVKYNDAWKYINVPIKEEQDGRLVDTDFIHQLIEYPHPNPKMYLTCDDPRYPRIGMKENNKGDPETILKYPYVPCCYEPKSNKMGVKDPKIIAYYKSDRYGKGVIEPEDYNLVPAVKAKIKESIRKNKKIIKPGEYAIINPVIEGILKSSGEISDFVRRGTIRSHNSLLHALMNAVENDSVWVNNHRHLNLNAYYYGNDIQREDYIIGLRTNIMNIENYRYIVSQEMYDMTEEERFQRINDLNLFFDSKLYYRMLEEFFNVNIFIMSDPEKKETKKKDKGKMVEEGIIQIPRHKMFHIRIPNLKRKSVAIYSHLGRGATSETYPQYENIVGAALNPSKNKVERITYQFGGNTTELLYKLLLKVDRIDKFTIENYIDGNIMNRQVKHIDNPYSHFDYIDRIGSKIIAQTIDAFGKVRAFLLHVADKNNNMYYISLIVEPTQPLNLPLYNREPYAISIEKTMELVGSPVIYAVDRNSQNQIVGLWYPSEDKGEFLYFPVIPVNDKRYDSLRTGKQSFFLRKDSNNEIENSKRLHKMNLKILRLLIWLFSIYQKTYMYSKEHNVETFIRDYLDTVSCMAENGCVDHTEVIRRDANNNIISDPNDPVNVYNFNGLEPKLPNIVNIGSAIAYLEERVNFIRKGRFYMYSDKYSNGVIYFLRQYNKQTIGLNLEYKSSDLRGYLREEEDFIVYPDNLIFLRYEDLRKWKDSILLHQNNMKIYDTFKIEFKMKQDPFKFYNVNNDKTYIVQNVQNGSDGFYRAISVATRWYGEGINYGYNSKITINQTRIPHHIIHGLNTDGKLDIIDVKTVENQPYLEILKYSIEKDGAGNVYEYAALLPIA